MNGEKHIKGKNSIKVLIKKPNENKQAETNIYLLFSWIFADELILDKQYIASVLIKTKKISGLQ